MSGRARYSLIVLGLYVLLTLLMTMPAASRATTHIFGSGGDPWQTLWHFTEKAEVWRTAAEAFVAGRGADAGQILASEFLGGGEPRLVNVSVWPWLPLHFLFGQPLAYNLVWALSFVLAGWGMYWLVKTLLVGRGVLADRFDFQAESAAFLAGVLYMFFPYHAAHAYGHFGALQVQWLPWLLLVLFSWLKQPRWWLVGAGSLLVLAQAMTEHHYLLWFVLFTPWFLWFWRREIKQSLAAMRHGRWLWPAVSAVAILIGAMYWPTIRLGFEAPTALALGPEQTIRFSADVFSFFTPAPFHSLWGEGATALFAQYFTGNATEATHFLSITALLLIIFFWRSIPRRQLLFWLAVAGWFGLIALGPRLHVLGYVWPRPLPYAAVDSWPVFSAVRAVARASVMVGLAAAVLFGLVCYREIRGRGLAAGVLGLILLEFLFWPIPLMSARLSPVYEAAADLPGRMLIEIPAATNYTAASRALYAAQVHGKDVFGNFALERGAVADAEFDPRAVPVVRHLAYLGAGQLRENRTEFFGQDMTETLADVAVWLDAAAVLIHEDSLTAAQSATLRAWLENTAGLQPRSFGDARLYVLSGALPAGDGVFASRGEGWSRVRYEAESNVYKAEVERQAELVIVNTTPEPKTAQISFVLSGEMVVRESDGVSNQFRSGFHTVMIDVWPGQQTVRFLNRADAPAVLTSPVFTGV